MNNSKQRDWVAIFPALLLGYWMFQIIIEALPGLLADYNGHTYVILPLFRDGYWGQALMTMPYFLWHVTTLVLHTITRAPLETSAALGGTIYYLLGYAVLYDLFRRVERTEELELGPMYCSIFAFLLSIVQMINISYLDNVTAYSINMLHNPTQTCVRPFATLVFVLMGDHLLALNGKKKLLFPELDYRRRLIAIGILLFLSVLAKPSFAQMFIPTVALYMLVIWIVKIVKKQEPGAWFTHCLRVFLCALPSVIYSVFAVVGVYVLGGSVSDGNLIITEPFEVWYLFSDSVILAVFLQMAFPLYMLMIDGRYFLRSTRGKLAWFGYLIGFVQSVFLGESGQKLSHANMMWPMISGMILVWLVSTIRLMKLLETSGDSKGRKVLLYLGVGILGLHALYGLMMIRAMTGLH